MVRHPRRHDPLKNLLGFIVGEVHYCLHISCVREIANPLPLVELPRAPHSLSGVADYRGEVVPVIDMRARFGLTLAPTTRRTKWILIDIGGRVVALVVDAVTDVFGTGGTELRAAPALGGGDDLRGIEGVTSFDGRMVFVLDITRFAALTAPLLASGDIGGSPIQGPV